ncbi:MAG TPA: phospholipase D-like domain-containing protein [Myxococcota bacterium]|nr:phospholipase D-like domain-containing protein [Myxococcota bacterium]
MPLRFPRFLRSARTRRRELADLAYLGADARGCSQNRVSALRAGGEAFPAMLAAIAAARRSIQLETYILRADRIGTRFQAALCERARAGVTVHLLYDAVGSFTLPAKFVAELREAGVHCAEFRPVAPWRSRWGLNRRDHKKMLIVDGELAFVGGLNIGDEYCAPLDGGAGWHDSVAQIEGPAVRELAALFAETWLDAGGDGLPPPPRAGVAAPARGSVTVRVIANSGMVSRPRMRRAVLRAIRRAEKRVSIMNAYFIPDRRLRRELARAVARGALVRVIVPSRSDLHPVYYASRRLYPTLLRSGVRIFEWQGAMMHAKLAVIDGVWSTIGSYNLDRRSFIHNLEVALLMIDRELGAELERHFERDLEACNEITLAQFDRRPFWQGLLERFWYALRFWL